VFYLRCNFHYILGNGKHDIDIKPKEIQIKLFEMIELLWSLAEILFVEIAPGNNKGSDNLIELV